MLLSIFIFLVFVSLVLIVAGYYIEAPVAQIAGTAIMFITGLLLLLGSVEYVSGVDSERYYQYGNNFSGENPHWDSYSPGDEPVFNPSDKEAFLFHVYENSTNVYSTWDEEILGGIKTRHTVAFLLLISAILVFISVLSQLREGIDDE
jgi:hypothetical protein